MNDRKPDRPRLQTLHEVKRDTFIFEKHNALPIDVCNEIIRRFEASTDEQYNGRIGQTTDVDQSIKRTTDLVTSGKDNWKDLDNELFRSLSKVIHEFRETFPFFKGPFKDMGYNVQRYLPGGYYRWHIDSGSHQFADRQLVALWYLNDVEGPGGETEFFHQDMKIKPEAGKLVVFPPFWTHEHQACELHKGVKYIATTWVLFA